MVRSMKPVRKVTAAGTSGALATVVVWIVDTAVGVEVPAVVAAAIATLVAAGTGYGVPSAPGEPGR